MARTSIVIVELAILLALPHASVLAAAPRVEMEVVMAPGLASNTAAQKWTKILDDSGIGNVRFRALQNGDHVAAAIEGSGDKMVVHVTAQLSNRGSLITPGGQFNVGDGPKLKKWLVELAAAAGQQGQRKTVFGLTPNQFDDVKKSLATPVGFATKDQRPEKVIERIRGNLKLPLIVDPTLARDIATDDPVRDELKELSTGAALAAMARPVGAVLLPRATANGVELTVAKPQAANGEMWPIGWPPEEKDETKILPALFQFIPVDIDGAPAGKAIDAMQERLKIPMLFDYNNMARNKVDLKKPVKLPPGKSFYRKIMDNVLFQVGLKAEVRLDDAGKPFLWITPL